MALAGGGFCTTAWRWCGWGPYGSNLHLHLETLGWRRSCILEPGHSASNWSPDHILEVRQDLQKDGGWGKRMGFTKVGETEVACCYSRSGLGGTVIQRQCLSPEGPLLGQGMVSLKSQLFPSLSLGTLVYLRPNRFC